MKRSSENEVKISGETFAKKEEIEFLSLEPRSNIGILEAQ